MRLPAVLTAGDSATWSDDPFVDSQSRNITSTDYALSYSLRGPVAAAGLDLVATPLSSGWSTAMTTAQTAALNTGSNPATWFWQAFVTKTGERITAGQGTLRVLPNLAGLSVAAVYDGSTDNEKTLAAIRAEIKGRQSGGYTVEYTVGSRSLKKEPMAVLLALESRYAWKVSRERRAMASANGLGKPGRMGVRFK